MPDSFKPYPHAGLAIDPIHVGTGGARLGRVDNTIVRDPITRIPKIPGSSLAGVLRAYTAMAVDVSACAGQGQPGIDGSGGHCGKSECRICTVFGFARGAAGGFAGLAAFSDAHVLLFPVATREGPLWVTCPMVLRLIKQEVLDVTEDAVYRDDVSTQHLNLGWLMLPVRSFASWPGVKSALQSLHVPDHILGSVGVVPDRLFSHVVNSNLEVRTSVSINPETGAAEDGALFTYEALPRATVLYWEVTCRNPGHFKLNGESPRAVTTPDEVHGVLGTAYPYLEHLGIGGMGTRGMGRLRVLGGSSAASKMSTAGVSRKAS